MSITLKNAKKYAAEAVVTFNKSTFDFYSRINRDGTVEMVCGGIATFPAESLISNVGFTIDIKAYDLKSTKKIAHEDVQLLTDSDLDGMLGNVITFDDSDEFDREIFKTGYYNDSDQPESVEHWLCRPDFFLLYHTSALKGFEDLIRDHFKSA